MLDPRPADYCRIPPSEPARLIVVVDTEEEFDWSCDFSRANTSVRSMSHIDRVQKLFDDYGATPVYVIDYPVASQPEGFRPLTEIHRSGRCLIGAHLHPWVNPPFREEVNRRNSFPGNLPSELEAEKLRLLGDCIEQSIGDRPVIYKAGRYGIGANTAAILEQQGYEVDLSVCPQMDYSEEHGPNFVKSSASPYWFGTARRLLEVPLTVGFTGALRRWGAHLHGWACGPALRRFRAAGILARLGMVNKVWLSPEGYLAAEHRALVRSLYHDGLRVFSFAFHSPSVEPGNTPYVGSQRELEGFLERCRRFFEFFLGELGGKMSTPLEIRTKFASTYTSTS